MNVVFRANLKPTMTATIKINGSMSAGCVVHAMKFTTENIQNKKPRIK